MTADRLIRAHRATSRWRDRLWVALSACFDGVWLGLLDHERLARLDEAFYAEDRDVEGTSYADESHNLAGLYAWEGAAIGAHFPGGARVVVTGAGGGREVVALLDCGFDAVGFEPNGALVSAGSALLAERAHHGRLLPCERDAFPAPAPPCDALVVGWGSYSLIAGRARRLAFLRDAHRALPAGAPMLCSFLLRREGRYHAIVAATAWPIRRARGADAPELGDTVHRHFLHFFTREELESELTAGGFRVVAYGSQPYGHAVALAEPPGSP